jgi:ADP-ribosylglycohydrolase
MRPWYHVASTFWIVYALFLQNQTFQSLIDAIRIWYDTDSQASIIGSMVGALKWPFYEQKYIEWLKDKDDLAVAVKNFQGALNTIIQ